MRFFYATGFPRRRLTETCFATIINVQLSNAGNPVISRLIFLPSLSTINIVSGGPNMLPAAPRAVIVDASDAPSRIGESGAISLPKLGEFHPTMVPTHSSIKVPKTFSFISLKFGGENFCFIYNRSITVRLIFFLLLLLPIVLFSLSFFYLHKRGNKNSY